jgi:hypothetical protein
MDANWGYPHGLETSTLTYCCAMLCRSLCHVTHCHDIYTDSTRWTRRLGIPMTETAPPAETKKTDITLAYYGIMGENMTEIQEESYSGILQLYLRRIFFNVSRWRLDRPMAGPCRKAPWKHHGTKKGVKKTCISRFHVRKLRQIGNKHDPRIHCESKSIFPTIYALL